MSVGFLLWGIVFACGLWLWCAPAVAGVKAPFEGAFTPDEVSAEVGRVVTLRMRLLTHRVYPNLTVSLRVPEGVRLVGGQQQFALEELPENNEVVFDYAFEVLRGDEQRIIATFKALDLPQGEAAAIDFHAVINPRPKTDNFELIKDKNGKPIRLYKTSD